MGGVAKGLLQVPDRSGTILERLLTLARGETDDVVLVGRRPELASHASITIDDAELGSGPLGGLVALLEHARDRDVIAIASDMPFVEASLLARLVRERPEADVLAPRRDGFWEPLFARYRSSRVIDLARARLASRELGLQGLLDVAPASELSLSERERRQLTDWDTPEDVAR